MPCEGFSQPLSDNGQPTAINNSNPAQSTSNSTRVLNDLYYILAKCTMRLNDIGSDKDDSRNDDLVVEGKKEIEEVKVKCSICGKPKKKKNRKRKGVAIEKCVKRKRMAKMSKKCRRHLKLSEWPQS